MPSCFFDRELPGLDRVILRKNVIGIRFGGSVNLDRESGIGWKPPGPQVPQNRALFNSKKKVIQMKINY